MKLSRTKIRFYLFISISVNLTKAGDFSINTIDKNAHVCYNKDKLENKTKILTNKNKKQSKQKGNNKMPQETINLPNQVIDSEWRDDIDYQPYEDEKDYISP